MKKICISVLSIVILMGTIFTGLNVYWHRTNPEIFKKEKVYMEDKSDIISSKDNNYSYRLDKDNNACITGYKGNDVNVDIPTDIDGHKVTEIAEGAFAYNEKIEKINVPDTINTIELAAFGSCVNLKEVDFQGDVANVNKYTFVEFEAKIVAGKDTNEAKVAKASYVKVVEPKN